jgi:hypothetical protein
VPSVLFRFAASTKYFCSGGIAASFDSITAAMFFCCWLRLLDVVGHPCVSNTPPVALVLTMMLYVELQATTGRNKILT